MLAARKLLPCDDRAGKRGSVEGAARSPETATSFEQAGQAPVPEWSDRERGTTGRGHC